MAMARLQIDGCEIYYEVVGAGPPVVLVHGLGSCVRDWDRQIPAFAAHHTVIAVDLRGHGESGKPAGPYSMARFAADVARVLETLAVGPAHIVGLSLGGMVAFQLAVDAPQYVKSLAIVNSAPEVIPRSVREWLALKARVWGLRLLGLPKFAERIAAMNFPDPGQAAERRALAARIAANDVAAYRASTRAIVGWSVADRISSIRCPVLVVTADHDYTPVAHKERYAAKMPRARVAVIERSRHVTPIDQTEVFNRVVLEFLAAQDVPPA